MLVNRHGIANQTGDGIERTGQMLTLARRKAAQGVLGMVYHRGRFTARPQERDSVG
ncbi:hypothetical protein [Arsenophonus nasoniae]|uniref:Uncharacterized protein n=1 Tax=Arsenophonus nasoniae TaxID=638 RepID=A0ABY8NPS7_9GAMM|nr:hypothetical protein [Arsenophonus nasoniae]WGM06436.1 hypothetical protein QE258_03590 [Arsenophonus nasoniae]